MQMSPVATRTEPDLSNQNVPGAAVYRGAVQDEPEMGIMIMRQYRRGAPWAQGGDAMSQGLCKVKAGHYECRANEF